jgi:hypothetical protein
VPAGSSVRAALLVVMCVARAATAEPSAADKLFDQGRTLLREHKYAEACAAFEGSQKLDPQFGTFYNLASCEVLIGKLATAWQQFRELAHADTKPERRAASVKAAADLEPRLPKLVIEMKARPTGLAVTIDGADALPLLGEPMPVDLGDHVVVASAPGLAEQRVTVTAKERAIARLPITLAPAPKGVHSVPTVTAQIGEPTTHVDVAVVAPHPPRYRREAKLLVIGGGAAFAAGLIFGGITLVQWHHAETCTGCSRPDASHTAIVLGDVSTVLVIAGAIPAAVGGLYLWRTSGSSAVVVPTATPEGGGAAIVGSF